MKFKKSVSVLLASAVVMSFGASLSASALGSNGSTNLDTPHSIFCTFYGDAKTARGFTWFTDNDGNATQIMVGTKSDLSDATTYSNGTSKQVSGGDRTDGTTTENLTEYNHQIAVTGLTAGTKYYYKVGSSKGWSSVGTFSTQSNTNNGFSFIDVTDTQASSYGDNKAANADITNKWGALITKAMSTAPDASFVMDGGDICEKGNDLVQWNLFAKAGNNALMNTTFVPVAGNHETYYANSNGAAADNINIANSYSGYTAKAAAAQSNVPSSSQLFNICGPANDVFVNHFMFSLPSSEAASTTHKGAYYSFDYGNVHFMVLNTNDLIQTSVYDASGTEKKVGGSLSDAQIAWLNADAKASTAKWKIVTFHRAVQSAGSHVKDFDVQALRAQLLPLMAQDNIDLILQGHDHSYMRSKQIDRTGSPTVNNTQITEVYNGASTTFDVNALGSVFVIPGASDNKFYVPAVATADAAKALSLYPAVQYPTFESQKTMDTTYDADGKESSNAPSYAVIKIDGDKLTLNAYQYDLTKSTQNTLDTYALAKPDQTALVNQIAALPSSDKLSIKDEAAVKAAYDAYNALDAVEKSVVTNSSVLLDDVDLLKQMDPNFLATASNPPTGSNDNTGVFIIVIVGLFCAAIATTVIVKRKKASSER